MKKNNHIPLGAAKNTIITALEEFHPELGWRACEILFDEDRLNIAEEKTAKTKMMMCRPAGVTINDLDAADMYIPDFKERYGPQFTEQENLGDKAIIDFEYIGTAESIEWLAHELGHAIADNIQRENGHSFRDFSTDEREQQAYFVQNIVRRYIKDNFHEPTQQETNPGGDSSARQSQFQKASNVFNQALEEDSIDKRANIIQNALNAKAMSI
jgi:hypothetical protein